MIAKVQETITEYRMIQPGDHVLVGVSGGADSVCLLALLREYQKRCPFSMTVVHVEHGIRGEESLRDARFVEDLCRSWELSCRIKRIRVRDLAQEEGLSIEEAGRQARYTYFEECRRELGADRIAVAHHQNDQAETVLFHLVRGSGVRGLAGICPVRGYIIRPLLFVSREEIERYLKEQGISYCTDQTNQQPDYSRNRLRLQILPELERSVNKEAVKHIAQCAVHLQKAERYLQSQAKKLEDRCVQRTERGIELSLPEFLEAEDVMQEYALRGCIQQLLGGSGLKDYTAGHVEDMKRLAQKADGKRMDFPGGVCAVRRGERLVFTDGSREKRKTITEESAECMLSESGIYELQNQRFQVDFLEAAEKMPVFPEKKYTKWLACDTIKGNICLRTRREGDYLVINREGGRKKLKDYLIDQKIPREERDELLLVAQGSHVLWVVGARISEAAKVTDKTEKLIKIQRMGDKI